MSESEYMHRKREKREARAKAQRKPVTDHILRYLRKHPSGLSAAQIDGWLKSRVTDAYTLREIEEGFYRLRDASIVSCTDELWWIR